MISIQVGRRYISDTVRQLGISLQIVHCPNASAADRGDEHGGMAIGAIVTVTEDYRPSAVVHARDDWCAIGPAEVVDA